MSKNETNRLVVTDADRQAGFKDIHVSTIEGAVFQVRVRAISLDRTLDFLAAAGQLDAECVAKIVSEMIQQSEQFASKINRIYQGEIVMVGLGLASAEMSIAISLMHPFMGEVKEAIARADRNQT